MKKSTRQIAIALGTILSPAFIALAQWLSGEMPGRAALGTALVGAVAAMMTWLQAPPPRRAAIPKAPIGPYEDTPVDRPPGE